MDSIRYINNINKWWLKYLDEFWGYYFEFSNESLVDVLGYIPKGETEIGYDSMINMNHELIVNQYINIGDEVVLPECIRFWNYEAGDHHTIEEETFGKLYLSETKLKVKEKKIEYPYSLEGLAKDKSLIFVVDLPKGSYYEFNNYYIKPKIVINDGRVKAVVDYPIKQRS